MPDDDYDDPLCEVELRTYDDTEDDVDTWVERYELMGEWLGGHAALFNLIVLGKC